MEKMLDLFPQAHIYTGFCKPLNISQKILAQKIFSGKIPGFLGFLMPLVFEGFDLRQYDIIISEGTAWPKGVLTNPDQLHISYIYTPPRFLYGYATEGQKRDKWYLKPFLKVIDHFLRIWDYSAAQRPDHIISISQEVAARIKKFYGRESQIIYPPVDTNVSQITEDSGDDLRSSDIPNYYLCISRLAAYKNIGLLIEAFNKTNLNLVIAGTGKEETRLKELSKGKTELLGFVDDEKKRKLLEDCKGFIFPTDHEDFGIVVVEALAYGKPVLCHKSGGPLEIVSDGVTGMFFSDLNPEKLAKAITEFDKNINEGRYNSKSMQKSAEKFSSERFKQQFLDFVLTSWEKKQSA